VHAAYTPGDVREVLARADAAAAAGRWAAVMVAYEAAPAFDPAIRGRAPIAGLPLAWVAEYDDAILHSREEPAGFAPHHHLEVAPSLSSDDFVRQVLEVQEQIRAGITYQANLTFPLAGAAPGDPAALYASLRDAQQAAYCATLDLGRHLVLSFSPELFFERTGTRLEMRPMKGTARRGRWWREDRAIAEELRRSSKARAENVMIVDLLRNDAGRIATPGTVLTPQLYALERYPTLWQMTSTVSADIPATTTIVDILAALFPCGSVTGAPKIRTMQVLAALEGRPRGVYTGAIGLVRPGGDCTFSVAIRTVVIDRETQQAALGVGAGITIDSDPDEEYRECLLKAAFALGRAPDDAPFSLLETMRLEEGTIHRFERHLARMRHSADYFGFTWDHTVVRRAVEHVRARHVSGVWRLRVLLNAQGTPHVTCAVHEDVGRTWRVALASSPIDDRSPFLFNKTTRREVYEAKRRERPDADEVLLWNERGEITEATIASVVVERDGDKLTPQLECGLLPGIAREEAIERGEITEAIITRHDLVSASRLWLLNSLRGWMPATLID